VLLATPAWAHVPHDTVRAVAAPPDLDASTPWLAALSPEEHLLLRSDDGGTTWEMLSGEPLVDELTAAAALDGRALLLGEDGLWWSDDGGGTWTLEDPPGSVARARVSGGAWLLGGDGGAWAGEPGAWSRVLDRPLAALGEGPTAIGTGNELFDGATGAWVEVDPPVAGVLSVAHGDALYAGAEDGSVWRWDGDAWAECGSLPVTAYPHVTHLAWSGDGLVAATAADAPFLSTDGCATWIDRSTPEDPEFGREGGPESEVEGWTVLAASGDRWLLAGWSGVWATEDAGVTWAEAPMVSAAYTRGLAFLDDRVLLGDLGAGVAYSDDGGATWSAPGEGLDFTSTQRLLIQGDTVYGIVGHEAWRSEDGGASWTLVDLEARSADEIVAWEEEGHLWVFRGQGEGVEIRETWNGGGSWSRLEALEVGPAGGIAVGAARLDSGPWCLAYATPAELACTDDVTTAPTTVLASEGDFAARPVSAGSRVLSATEVGIHAVGGDLSVITTALDGDVATTLAVADDGTAFAATRSGELWRSQDGGASWSPLALDLGAWPFVIAPRPGFAATDELLVGTAGGRVLVRDGEAERWAPWERVDDASGLADYDGDTDRAVMDGAGLGAVRLLAPGSAVTVWVRGTSLAVHGTLLPGGSGQVVVDGSVAAQLAATEPTAAVEGLADTWHEVTVTAGTEGVAFDAVEAWSEGAVLAEAEAVSTVSAVVGDRGERPPGSRGCGCAGSPGIPSALALAVAPLSGRRRAARRPPTPC
jgi:hypothetical protein